MFKAASIKGLDTALRLPCDISGAKSMTGISSIDIGLASAKSRFIAFALGSFLGDYRPRILLGSHVASSGHITRITIISAIRPTIGRAVLEM